MAGIYIHIPFCRSRCIYCGFYSTTRLELRQRYVEAVVKELGEVRGSKRKLEVNTIYLGGGTPSQLSPSQLNQIFDTIYNYNKVKEGAEITIEVNPDDVTEEYAEGLRSLPVNRVSMGAQTFSDARLRFLHRRHTSRQVAEAVDRLRKVGIRNINIDLIYGFPDETISDWEQDINHALALHVEHLSAYCLMIEEGTPLHKMVSVQGDRSMISANSHLPDEELVREMYEQLIDRLTASGYEHYEISNFAKPSFRSRHNSNYWNGTPYIGIGAAAHSYEPPTRSWNTSDIQQYIESMEHGKRIFEEEVIDEDTHYNDMVTVALRTREGLNLWELSEKHRTYAINKARRFISNGLLLITSENHLTLTRRGLFVSDMVMSELIYI